MRPIPLPVRVAAGLVVTAVEQARKFPERLAELPVTAASRVVQTGMRVQQRVTALAIKGDEVFSLFQRVEDTPPWARFDEDEEPSGSPSRPGADDTADRRNGRAELAAVVPGPGLVHHGEIDEATVARAMAPEPEPADAGGGASPSGEASTPEPGSPESGTPPALPGYDELSLAQLRGKLRALSLLELEELLEHEHAHQDRAPFVTMLSNRIVTVRSR